MSVTQPTIFAAAVVRKDSISAWILRVEVTASLTLLFSDVSGLSLTDGEVYPTDLLISELIHSATLYQTASTSGTAKVVMSNAPFRVDTSNVGERPSFKLVLMANRPVQIYLAVGAVTALTDCLKIFDGVAVADPEYSSETMSLELVDISATENDLLPNENIADDFPDSIAARLARQYPITLGTLKHADAYHAGPLALAEELQPDDWVLSNDVAENVTEMWLFHQGFGDFMKNNEVAATTLATAGTALDATIDLTDRADFSVSDRIIIDKGGANEELHTITGWSSGHVADITPVLVNNQSAGETVDRAYVAATDGTRASLKLMRRILEIEEVDVRYRVEAFDLKGYIRPESQSNAPEAFIHSRKHQTFCANATSSSGQAILNVDSTIGMSTGQVLDIDPDAGGGGAETKTVKRVTGITTVELTANLTFSHTVVQADVVRSQDVDDASDIEDFDKCRDRRSDTFCIINAAGSDSGFFGVLNCDFTDIDTRRSNVDNNVGFIYDYGSFANIVAEPGITLSGGTPALIMVAGRGVPDPTSEHRFSSRTKTLGTTDEDSHFSSESILLMLSATGEHSVIPTATNNSGQAFIDILNGQSRGFNAGSKCTFGAGTVREERVVITNIENGTRINLVDNLVNNHGSGDSAAIRTLRNDDTVGVFWALATGDQKIGIGVKAQISVFSTTGGIALGDPLARVQDVGLFFNAYVFNRPFATQPIVYGIIGTQSGGRRGGADPGKPGQRSGD